MRQTQIAVGGLYKARVSGNIVTVRVDRISRVEAWAKTVVVYGVTNLATGRTLQFRSARKFRCKADPVTV